MFCRFLRNWRSLNKNKNRRSSWGFCKSLKIFFTCRFCFFLSSLMWPFLLLFYFFLLYVFLPHFWRFTLFFLFLPPVNLNARFWNSWLAKGSEKDKAFYAHFLPIQMVTSHSRDLWCMFFFFLIIVQFESWTQKKSTLVYIK